MNFAWPITATKKCQSISESNFRMAQHCHYHDTLRALLVKAEKMNASAIYLTPF